MAHLIEGGVFFVYFSGLAQGVIVFFAYVHHPVCLERAAHGVGARSSSTSDFLGGLTSGRWPSGK